MADQRTLDQHHQTGMVRTDLYCHECNKHFIAELDFDIDGKHVVECPHCGHEHCRYIQKGFVSNERWEGRNSNETVKVPTRRVWKHNSLKATTSSASEFIRNRWLNFGGD
jgi:DNA-directed RNA polymerase subunit RPC12/RpoP